VRRQDLPVVVDEHDRAGAVEDRLAPLGDGRADRPLPTPAPAASTPMSRTPSTGIHSANDPMAFEPPPTQATTASGMPPAASANCWVDSTEMTFWSSRTMVGKGCGPIADPMR
jgi:hypothetical protein